MKTRPGALGSLPVPHQRKALGGCRAGTGKRIGILI